MKEFIYIAGMVICIVIVRMIIGEKANASN